MQLVNSIYKKKKKQQQSVEKKGQIEGSWKILILSRGCFKSLYPINDATKINNISDENELKFQCIPIYDKYTMSIDKRWSTSDINFIINVWGSSGVVSAIFPCCEIMKVDINYIYTDIIIIIIIRWGSGELNALTLFCHYCVKW